MSYFSPVFLLQMINIHLPSVIFMLTIVGTGMVRENKTDKMFSCSYATYKNIRSSYYCPFIKDDSGPSLWYERESMAKDTLMNSPSLRYLMMTTIMWIIFSKLVVWKHTLWTWVWFLQCFLEPDYMYLMCPTIKEILLSCKKDTRKTGCHFLHPLLSQGHS